MYDLHCPYYTHIDIISIEISMKEKNLQQIQ